MTDDAGAEVRRTLGMERRGLPGWAWGVGALLLAGAAVALWQARGGAAGSGRWDYETVTVERGELVVRVDAIGTLEPVNAVSVGSELSGIVSAVHVAENQQVTQGQLLVELDRQVLSAQARQARAATEAAEASLQQALVSVDAARQDADRARRLHEAKTISDAALEQAVTAHRQAVAGVALAEAQLAQSRASYSAALTNLEKTQIVAPIDGVVLERSVEPGQAVVSSLQAATLFKLAGDLHQMQVEVEIDEADVGRVKPGQSADFTVPAYADRVFSAKVQEVHLAPTGTTDVVTYQATLSVENPELALLPGMTASVAIAAQQFPDALLVPNRALRFQPDDSDLAPPEARDGRKVERVWLLGDPPTPVEVLPVATDGRRTAVEGGVSAGDALVVAATRKRGRAAGGAE